MARCYSSLARGGLLLGILTVQLTVTLAFCANARAATFIGNGPFDDWARRVIATSRVPIVPDPPITLIDQKPIVDGQVAGGGWIGSTSQLFIGSRSRIALMHELGHAFDDRLLDVAERQHLVALMQLPGDTPWSNPARWTSHDPFCAETMCLNERFADAYAACALGYLWVWWGSVQPWSWWPSRWRYKRFCGAIWRYSVPKMPAG